MLKQYSALSFCVTVLEKEVKAAIRGYPADSKRRGTKLDPSENLLFAHHQYLAPK